MKIRRYRGKSLEAIREQVLKELGSEAMIVSTQQEQTRGLLGSRKGGYEVIAAVDEATVSPGPGNEPFQRLEAILAEHKEQVMNMRRTLKLLDDKVSDMEGSLRVSALDRGESGGILGQIHEGWRSQLAETAHEIAGDGTEPDAEAWHAALMGAIPTRAGIHFRPTPGAAPDVYCLVGPTGVGKTTTLAKLAAKCVLQERLTVGIVTIDTFRVGAVDQIREYAELLGIAVRVAFTAEELASHLEQCADRDVVFIDTPGRGYYDAAGIARIRDCLGENARICVALTVPASLRAAEAADIAATYGTMKPAAIILTKTDEARRCDGLTQLIAATDLPIVYLTDGQRVPEDIAPASSALVAALIARPANYAMPIQVGGTAA